MAQSLANVPHTIRLWRLGQIQLRVDERGRYTIRRCVVIPFAQMHLTDIAGDVGSSCEVHPWLKASVADTDYSILDMWGIGTSM